MKGQFSKMILVCLPAIFIVFYLFLFEAEYAFSDSSSPGGQVIEESEDTDYWVHIRNVSIYNGVNNRLQKDMFVLVTGKHIHKIGKTPLFIMDKDITFNLNGEGRILMVFPEGQGQSEYSGTAGVIAEGALANLLIIDTKSLADLSMFKDDSGWQEKLNLQEVEMIRLIMQDGEIIKNTLPRTRVARFGLRKVLEKPK